MKHSEETKNQLKNLFKALSELRWDEMNEEELKKAWGDFCGETRVPEFFVGTLATIVEAGDAYAKEKEEKNLKVLKTIINRRKMENEEV